MMRLLVLPGDFSVCRLSSLDGVDFAKPFTFAARTDDEISYVCPTDAEPAECLAVERGWRAFKIDGILDFGMIGIIANIAALMAQCEISVFVASTFNTDYILIKAEHVENACATLLRHGYEVIR